jgi:cytochrome c oxidase subunit III
LRPYDRKNTVASSAFGRVFQRLRGQFRRNKRVEGRNVNEPKTAFESWETMQAGYAKLACNGCPTQINMKYSRNHSSYLLIALLIAGISFLFLSLIASLTYLTFNQTVGSIVFPYWFLLTTAFIVALSYFAEKTKQSFREGKAGEYKKNLQFVMASIVLFLLGQLRTWYAVLSEDIFMETNNAYAFLYLLSGLHLLHVLAVIPFVLVFYIQFCQNYREEHQVQLYFSDETKYRNLDQLAIYSHFMGILWLILLVAFSAMSLL